MTLTDRHVLVTGGSLGIGREIAVGLASNGASCTLIARGKDDLAITVDELPIVGSAEHRFFAMDVARLEEWNRYDNWRSNSPPITDLVCSAGIYGPIGPLGSYDVSEFQKTIDINLMGIVLAVTHLVSDLERKAGSILILAGGGAASPNPNFTPYGVSKAALVRLAENLSGELRPRNIIVNSCAPGFVNTRLHQQTLASGPESAGKDFFDKTKKVAADKAGDSVSHVVDLAQFLIDPGNDRFTGKFISAVWDKWRDPAFRKRLRSEKDFCSVRRIDDVFFSMIEPDE